MGGKSKVVTVTDQRDAIQIAQKYLKLISSIYSVRSALLFGSFAKGTNDEDSDIAVILNNGDDIIDIQIALMKLRRTIDLRIEPHPFFFKDFERSNPVANEIIKYGIDLTKIPA